jgi:cold shock CspA family protein
MRPALFADRAARAGWLHVRPRMPLNGTLRSWNDDRGYGFIAPRDGGREIFVHVSAFPRDGSRPTVGESLVYELGSGKDGKPQAVRVYRQALQKPLRVRSCVLLLPQKPLRVRSCVLLLPLSYVPSSVNPLRQPRRVRSCLLLLPLSYVPSRESIPAPTP